ncbi:ATP-binding protein [Abyssibacter sp.]|uniref:ATP-binding protein n=1 Tax=Abyssibacter sp. TaxID=2320200 RepID=UPI0025BB2CDE|nr:ATP-binding protein [Abyssibacter sp.]MCK5858212.1 response regulator [Abyssibacter sp.]
MNAATTGPDERARCEALWDLNILDTPPEARFDRLTRLAQQLFGVEIALVSLVDADRQWFKSRQGLEVSETARSVSFCSHAIDHDRPLVIEDTLQDDRFAENPLVVGEPHIRFYAGCPLKGPGGYLIGTLCIIDPKPRRFSDQDRDALRVLGELVEVELREPRLAPSMPSVLDDRWQLARRRLKTLRDRLSYPVAAALTGALAAMTVLVAAWLWDSEQTHAGQDHARHDAFHNASLMLGRLESELAARLHLVYALSGQVHAGVTYDESAFQNFAAQLAGRVRHVVSLQLAPDAIVTHVWPIADHRAAIGHDLMSDPSRRRTAQRAIDSEQVWVSGPVPLLQGGEAVIGRLPILLPREASNQTDFWGFASVLIDLDGLLRDVGFFDAESGFEYALRAGDTTEGVLPSLYGSTRAFTDNSVTIPVAVPGGDWTMGVIPQGGWPTSWSGRRLFWALALVASALTGVILHALLRLPAHTRMTIKRTVSDMESSHARFRDAIQALPAGFVIFDRDDRLNICNDRYRELYARARPRLQIGRQFEDILDFAISADQFAITQGMNAKAKGDFREVILQRHRMPRSAFDQKLADGRWVRVVEQRMRDGGTVSFHVDVSDQKASTRDLIDARQKAEQANQAKSTFLATVSHEVRTPLNGVIGLLSVLSGDAGLNAQQTKYVQTAHQSAQHLLGLLNEILDISKMEADKLELEASDCRLSTMVDSVVDLVRAQAESKSLDLKVRWDDGLRSAIVIADEARLRQIVLNLMSNAIKFTDCGQVTLRLRAAGDIGRTLPLRIEVEDTGIGFDPDQAERLFTPFDQLDDNAARRFAGTGLGLAICKRLVELMGGTIGAHGEPGKGARFYVDVEFPVARTVTDNGEAPAATPLLPSELGWPAVRILLAEDSPTNQMVIRAMLQNTGYRVDVVSNGLEALEALQRLPYDLVLMDVFMPEMDGVTATRKLRERFDREHLPVVALTANAMQGDEERFLAAGMNEHLTKPLERAALLRALHRWLEPTMTPSPAPSQPSEELHNA